MQRLDDTSAAADGVSVPSARSSRSSSGRRRRREDEDDEANIGLRLVGSGLHRLGRELEVTRVHDDRAHIRRRINELEDTRREYRRRRVEASTRGEEGIVAFYNEEVADLESQISRLEGQLPQPEPPQTP